MFICIIAKKCYYAAVEETGQVRAIFNYTKDVDGLTEIYFYESEKAKDVHHPGDDPREMVVHDGVSACSCSQVGHARSL